MSRFCCSRLYGLSKNYLYCPSSGLYSCPLAMTDGAAKIIEVKFRFEKHLNTMIKGK